MTSPTRPNKGPGSRALIVALLVAAVVIALLPLVIARTRRVQTMRVDLAEVLGECRAMYEAAATAADTAAVDAAQPMLHGALRAGDPACGPYRRRNMLPAPPR